MPKNRAISKDQAILHLLRIQQGLLFLLIMLVAAKSRESFPTLLGCLVGLFFWAAGFPSLRRVKELEDASTEHLRPEEHLRQ